MITTFVISLTSCLIVEAWDIALILKNKKNEIEGNKQFTNLKMINRRGINTFSLQALSHGNKLQVFYQKYYQELNVHYDLP